MKAEGAGLKAHDLAKRCNVGTATMYRYIRGVNNIPDAVEQALGDVLMLNELEKHEFREIIENSSQLRPMSKAFRIIDKMIFNGKSIKKEYHTDDPAVFLENDRYFMTVQEIRERMMRNINEPNFECCMRLVGDNSEVFLDRVVHFMEALFEHVENVTVEHLVPISEKDYADSIRLLISVLPLLKYTNYTLYYLNRDDAVYSQGIFTRSIYFSTSFNNENGQRQYEYFMCTWLRDGRSACICFNNPFMHEFFTDEFFDLRKLYKTSFMQQRSSKLGLDFVVDLEKKYPMVYINPELGLVRIPVDAYHSMFERLSAVQRHKLIEGFTEKNLTIPEGEEDLKGFLSVAETRQRYSFTHQHIDIYSKEGLLKFAQTGLLYNNLDWLPPFGKEEIRLILEYIRDRNMDDNDKFNLYITDKPILVNEYHIFIYNNTGVLFYSNIPQIVQVSNSICIENNWLANLFSEYAQTYIPANHAISKKETTTYLNGLIDLYLN
jgi:hypothetical protein